MPTIVIASPKGGAGKSTSAILLGTELALKGADVTLLDADPNKPLSEWSQREGRPKTLIVEANGITEDTIVGKIKEAAVSTPFVIVDLEGTASLTVAYAISEADLVVIPTQGSHLDAKETAKAIELIKAQEEKLAKRIPFAILYTRTSPAIRPRTLQHVQRQFHKYGLHSFETHIHEREAYRALFSFGGTLEGLDPKKVPNLDAAIINARAFAGEVISMLRSISDVTQQTVRVA